MSQNEHGLRGDGGRQNQAALTWIERRTFCSSAPSNMATARATRRRDEHTHH
jgi:hypothetical protein